MDNEQVAVVRTGYDRLAGRYDEWSGTVAPDLRGDRATWVAEQVGPDGRVLELGCGTGMPAAVRLAPRVGYVGIDVSPEMIRIARANVPSGEFWAADMRLLGLPPASFDAIIAFYSIIHVPACDQPRLFERVRRWLRPGGLFLASLAPSAEESAIDDDWLGAGPMRWSSLGAGAYRNALIAAGFEIEADEIIPQTEGDDPVEFLWLTCRRSV